MGISIIHFMAIAVHVICGLSLSLNKIPKVDSGRSERHQRSTATATTTSSQNGYELERALMIQEIESSDIAGTGWVEQKLDHFNNTDSRTWQMRYMYNGEYYRNNEVLIYLSLQYHIDYLLLKFGPINSRAMHTGSYMFILEGRFYGESLPTSDLSIESLQYASTDQLLADIEHSIETIIEKFSLQNATITLMGLRNSAAIGAWFQLTYPGLVHNVDAYRPLLLAKSVYPEYYEFLGTILRNVGGDSCYENITNAFDEYHTLIIERNTTELKLLLNICDNFNITNGLDVFSLFSQLAYYFTSFRGQQRICMAGNSSDSQDTPVTILSKVIVEFFNQRNRNCTDYTFANKYDYMRNTSIKTISRISLYRQCTEYGRFPIFDSLQQPFGNRSLTVIPNPCEYVFGEDFTLERIENGVKRTNKKFGGNRLIENVTYIFGVHDPIRYLSLLPNE